MRRVLGPGPPGMPCPNCCRFGEDYFVEDRYPLRVPPCECRWDEDGNLISERGAWSIATVSRWTATVIVPKTGPEVVRGKLRLREDPRTFTGVVAGEKVELDRIPGGEPNWSPGDILRLVE